MSLTLPALQPARFSAALLGAMTTAALLASFSGVAQASTNLAQTRVSVSAQSITRNTNHASLDANRIAPEFRRSPAFFRRASNALMNVIPNVATVFDSDDTGFGSSGNGFLESAPITNPPGGNINPFFFGVSVPGGLLLVKDDLYVANAGGNNILLVRSGVIFDTLADPGQDPSSIAVSRKGTFYVANIFNQQLGPGSISVYAKGSKTPTSMLTSPTFSQVIGIAVNGAGDVFANNNQGFFSGGQVIEFPGGTGTGQVLTNIHVKTAGGLKIDPITQDLLVVDQHARKVRVYAPPYTGRPKASYPVPNGGSAVDVTFDRASSLLYFADVFGTIDVISYPDGAFLGSYTGGVQPIGIAVQPSRLP